MRYLLWVLFLLLLACTRVTNAVNQTELNCGADGADAGGTFIPLFNDSGKIDDKVGLTVRDERGQQLDHLITAKGCLRFPGNLDQKLVISRPTRNEGAVIYPYRLPKDGVHAIFLKNYRYKEVTSTCQNLVATAAQQIPWPVDLQGQDPYAFAYSLQIAKDNNLIDLKLIGDDLVLSDRVDIRELADGSYSMKLVVKQLFSQDQLETQFACDLVVDRVSPLVSLDRRPILLSDDEAPAVRAEPGEAIKLQTQGQGSLDRMFACIAPSGTPAAECKFESVSGGFITAPNRGNWVLRVYAQDAAGNIGETVERNLQIYDSSLVAANRSYVDQAKLAKQAGSYMRALVSSVRAYEKMQEMSTRAEQNAVAMDVRQVLAETSSLPVEVFSHKQQQNDTTSPFGMILKNGQPMLMQSSQGLIEVLSTDGHIEDSFDLKSVLNSPSGRINQSFCDGVGRLIASSSQSAVIYDQGIKKAQIAFPENDSLWNLPEASQDCRFIRLNLGASQIVVDIDREQRFTVPGPRFDVLGAFGTDDFKVIAVNPVNALYAVLDLATAKTVPLTEALDVTDISLVKRSRNGSLGVLSKDGTLHFFNAQGQKTATIGSVASFEASVVADEFVVNTTSLVSIVSAADGLTKSEASFGIGNFSYLNADRDFIVALPTGGNALKVWTRAGGSFDEIYEKGDTITGVWMSSLGYFHVSSFQYSRVYQPLGGIARKTRPRYNFAVGLQFSADGKKLLFKEQQVRQKEGLNYVQHNFVSWDFERDQNTVFAAEGAPSYNSGVSYLPGYSALTKDLETFELDGHRYTAAAVKRGTIAIYKDEDFSTPVRQWYVTDYWILDIAVDVSKKVLAVASDNGVVTLYDLESGELFYPKLYLNDYVMGSSQEYPVNLVFGNQGQSLFVTDVNQNLLRFDQAEAGAYVFKQKVDSAGTAVQISPKGDQLVTVGKGSMLKVYDLDLKLKKEFNLGGSGLEIGQSVAYSPDAAKVYAGVYPGFWNEIDLNKNTVFKVKYGTAAAAGGNLVVSPKGDQIAFMNGAFVQLVELDVDQMYKKACAWLKPRLPYIPDLSPEERALCSK